MNFLVTLRFQAARAVGLMRRVWTSIQVSGWRATWRRVSQRLQRRRLPQRAPLYLLSPAAFSPFTVATSERPVVSIVIPVYNQFSHTLVCLRALAQHPPKVAFEVLVVDDGSSDETGTHLPQIGGVRYHRRVENGGFVAACNDGAAQAHGTYVVFLNNDTIPQPGWLDTLLETFDAHPNVGLVGAQLVFPDGRLQEAGGVVFSDGAAWNYGRLESPQDPRFSYVRDADYVSGAAIVIERALFQRLGGFAARYAPAYYEDTDLAFSVRSAGKRVLVQPAAQVVHLEGATAGTNVQVGPKAYQVRNQQRFATAWQAELAAHLPNGTVPTPATVHRKQKQILLIDAQTPQPDKDSGSLRLFNLMRMLCGEGAHVVFIPANTERLDPHTARLQGLGVEVWYAPYARSLQSWLREQGGRFDVVMLSRHYVAKDLIPLVRRYAPQARIVFDTVDLHYLREQRGAKLTGNASAAAMAQKTRTLELSVIAKADITLVVSEVERALLRDDAPGAPVELLSNLHDIAGPGQPYSSRHDLVFVGGFGHPPNVDAICWFAQDIFPLVRAQLPQVRLHCIGSNTPPEVHALAALPGVTVHGYVQDIAPYMDGCRIAVAPLRYGAGIKGKVNLSMAHGQPVVATTCAVEGMNLQHETDVMVADSAEDFAAAIVRLYQDEALWGRLADNGLRSVTQHFSLAAALDTVRRVFLTGSDAK